MTLLRDIVRMVLSVLLGPLIGGAVFFGAAGLYETLIAHAPQTLFSNFSWSHIPALLFFSYFLGFVPAVLSGLSTTAIAHLTHHRRRRLIYSTIAGAISSVVIIGWVVINGDTSIAPPPVFITIAAVGGGAGALVCVLLAERLVHRPHAVLHDQAAPAKNGS